MTHASKNKNSEPKIKKGGVVVPKTYMDSICVCVCVDVMVSCICMCLVCVASECGGVFCVLKKYKKQTPKVTTTNSKIIIRRRL